MTNQESPFKHLAHEFRLDGTYYYQSSKVFSWLLDHVGPGNASNYMDPMKDYSQTVWQAYQVFGTTVVKFAHIEDLIKFQLSWC